MSAVPAAEVGDLDWMIHAGLEDCRQACTRASMADIRHAIRHCAMNPRGNATRRKILETALKQRSKLIQRKKKGGRR